MRKSKKLSTEEMDVVWGKLIDVISGSKSRSDISTIIVATLGQEERVMMGKRLMVGILTLSDWSAYQIAEVMQLSPATVYKFQHLLSINPQYRSVLSSLIQEKVSPPDKITKSDVPYLVKLIGLIFEGRQNRAKLGYGWIDD